MAYIQPFKPVPGCTMSLPNRRRQYTTEKLTKMFRIERKLRPDGSRMGAIVPLTDIWSMVTLIPVFGKKCPEEWTCDNAVELAKQFRVNNFACKQTYQRLY